MLFVVFFLFFLNVCAEPTVRLHLNRAGWSFLNETALQVLTEEAKKVHIPEFKYTKGVTGLFIFNMYIATFDQPNMNFDLTSNGLTWNTNGGGLTIKGRLRAWWHTIFKITFGGTFEMRMTGLETAGTVSINAVTGRPQLNLKQFDIRLGKVRIITDTKIDFIIDMFRGSIEDAAKSAIKENAGRLVRAAVASINKDIAAQPLHFPIAKDLYIDYAMEGDTTFTKDFMEGNLDATIVFGEHKCPLKPPGPIGRDVGPMPSMANVWVSSQVSNCLLYSAHEMNLIHYMVTKNDKGADDYLRTTCSGICIGAFFPHLRENYPHRYIDVDFNTKTPPEMRLAPDRASLDAVFTIDLYMDPRQKNDTPLARLELSSFSSMSMEISGNRIVGKLQETKADVKEISSRIGPIVPDFLKSFKGLFITVEEILLNSYMMKGVIIPGFQNVTLAETSKISIMENFVRLNVDFKHQKREMSIEENRIHR